MQEVEVVHSFFKLHDNDMNIYCLRLMFRNFFFWIKHSLKIALTLCHRKVIREKFLHQALSTGTGIEHDLKIVGLKNVIKKYSMKNCLMIR